MSEQKVHINDGGLYLTIECVESAYLALVSSRFHAVWLRDNALDEATRSSNNGQRLITLLDQPAQPIIEQAAISNDHLVVSFAEDDTQYQYPLSWLMAHSYDRELRQQRGWVRDKLTLWGHELDPLINQQSFEDICQDKMALYAWLKGIERYGFGLISGLPDDPDSLFTVIEQFGFVRETNYGKVFEVRAEISPKNLAYTGLGLQAHTDNPYRDPVPTLQILSCIENTADGGESILVDGFHAAMVLQREKPEYFELLANHCANFRYAGDEQVDLRSLKPMIELSANGELINIRFNNRSAAPFTDIPFDVMQAYYEAYRYFAEIIERPESKIEFKLKAGELFIVNNQRVMHSRKGFSSGGSRWLRGAYADIDGLSSTLRVLEQKLELV